eukprot:GFYU01019791.1.p1 GENE.GFYU01019791.1~~GFYU01019791.1.p1  ORF type:complete len:483 (-),score=74.92 GFYU01019791.1:223-1611(-)
MELDMRKEDHRLRFVEALVNHLESYAEAIRPAKHLTRTPPVKPACRRSLLSGGQHSGNGGDGNDNDDNAPGHGGGNGNATGGTNVTGDSSAAPVSIPLQNLKIVAPVSGGRMRHMDPSLGVFHCVLEGEGEGEVPQHVAVKVVPNIDDVTREVNGAKMLQRCIPEHSLGVIGVVWETEDASDRPFSGPAIVYPWIAHTPPVTLYDRRSAGVQLLECMKVMHENKISHSDVKPGNLLWETSKKKLIFIDNESVYAVGEDVRAFRTQGFRPRRIVEGESEDPVCSDMHAVGRMLAQLLLLPTATWTRVSSWDNSMPDLIRVMSRMSSTVSQAEESESGSVYWGAKLVYGLTRTKAKNRLTARRAWDHRECAELRGWLRSERCDLDRTRSGKPAVVEVGVTVGASVVQELEGRDAGVDAAGEESKENARPGVASHTAVAPLVKKISLGVEQSPGIVFREQQVAET